MTTNPTIRRETQAISRTAILTKEPTMRRQESSSGLTTITFVIATLLLCYLATTLVLAAAL
jgi:hypothetical protein